MMLKRKHVFSLIWGISLLTSNKFYAEISAPSTIVFTENKGQISDQNNKPRPDVLFGGMANGMAFHLRNNGISYQLSRIDSWKEEEDLKSKIKRQVVDQSTVYRLDVNWLNSNTSSKIVKGDAFPGYNNYYLPVCPDGAHDVKSYNQVTYQNLYKGIDIKWYQKDGNLKYDYLVEAGADYKQINLEISGAQKIGLNNNGDLIIQTPLGDIIEQSPIVKQNGRILKSRWLINDTVLSFEIENIDSKLSFIIDPAVAVRAWGTYYGGTGYDEGRFCVTDATGNIYMVGYTAAITTTIIATVGSHQSVYGGGMYDAFVAKFNTSGARLWGTYYGGSGNDKGAGCSVDNNGNVFISGETESLTGIAIPGCHQSIFGGFFDAFLVKFNSAGVRQWGTYYGGTGGDNGCSCVTDVGGNIYMIGYTDSGIGNIIATPGSHQSFLAGGNDAFIVKFNSAGVRQWGTYYGAGGYDVGYSSAMDALGNIYFAGYTNGGANISSPGAHQTIFGGGIYDAFLVKFNSAGVRQWGTFYGGASDDEGWSCATDISGGNVYLSGWSQAATGTVIATLGSHQPTFVGGQWDVFLVKFNSAGVRQWGTYYGGPGDDRGFSCSTDLNGNVYIAGITDSNSGISTSGSHQPISGGGVNTDAFLAQFNSNGVHQWGTYYGTWNVDLAFSCATDANANVYMTGGTYSSIGTSIATTGSYQPTICCNSGDAFLVKFVNCNTPAPSAPINTTPFANQVICAGNTASLSATSASTINWFATLTSDTILGTGATYITLPLSTGVYTFYAEAFICLPSATRTAITVTVNATPNINITTISALICAGETSTLTATGGFTYLWNTGGTNNTLVVSPLVSTIYSVTVTGINGCQNTDTITQNVNPCTGVMKNYANSNSIKIYPNPNNSKFTLQVNQDIKEGEIVVFNQLGQKIFTENLCQGNNQIKLPEGAKGIYYYQILQSGRHVYNGKFVVE